MTIYFSNSFLYISKLFFMFSSFAFCVFSSSAWIINLLPSLKLIWSTMSFVNFIISICCDVLISFVSINSCWNFLIFPTKVSFFIKRQQNNNIVQIWAYKLLSIHWLLFSDSLSSNIFLIVICVSLLLHTS